MKRCGPTLEKTSWGERGDHSFTSKCISFSGTSVRNAWTLKAGYWRHWLILWRLQIIGEVTAIFHPFWCWQLQLLLMYGWHCLGQCLPVSQCVPCTVVTHTSTQLSTAKASGWTPPRLYSKSLSLQCFPASAFWSSSENASVGERLSAINAKQNFCWEGLK